MARRSVIEGCGTVDEGGPSPHVVVREHRIIFYF